jgi:hypothetical protein
MLQKYRFNREATFSIILRLVKKALLPRATAGFKAIVSFQK